MSNRQQFVQQYSENDMVLKVRARDRRRARTTLATVSRGSFRPSRTTLPLTRPDRSFRRKIFRENKRAQELERLEDDANVYKLIGPVLIKQDLVEAKSNVEKRLEFIRTRPSGWTRWSSPWRTSRRPSTGRSSSCRRSCRRSPPPNRDCNAIQVVRVRHTRRD